MPRRKQQVELVPLSKFIESQLAVIPNPVLCQQLGIQQLLPGYTQNHDTLVELIDGQFSRVLWNDPAAGKIPLEAIEDEEPESEPADLEELEEIDDEGDDPELA